MIHFDPNAMRNIMLHSEEEDNDIYILCYDHRYNPTVVQSDFKVKLFRWKAIGSNDKDIVEEKIIFLR